MKTEMVVGLGMFGMAVVVFLVMVMITVSINNTAIKMEAGVIAQYDQNQNTRSKMVITISEMAQVPEMYKDDYKEVLTAAVEGTYGEGGSKAVFQWIKERGIDFSPEMFLKIQNAIQSLRAEFALDQKKLIDKKRIYFNVKLKTFPNGTILRFLGFPKISENDYKVVVSQDNRAVFSDGVESPMKLR